MTCRKKSIAEIPTEGGWGEGPVLLLFIAKKNVAIMIYLSLKKDKIFTEVIFVQIKNGFALDKLGIFCSTACVIHCLLAPISIFISATIVSYLQSEWVHVGLTLSIIPIAGISFYSSKKLHQCSRPMKLGLLGIGLLMVAIGYEKVLGLEMEGLEIFTTVVGSTFLVIAHFNNMKCLRTHLQRVEQ